ncbi:ribose 5-phosphate isomerase B [Mycoplasma sp. SG1]|uniref:ribose 5-phosphate isomerase B n=1 Tax=Mycoplasma sp. SG1 TaxID=2810348 RepID=UPI002024738D|nr:ribose 5-phosphate isomerase B [Mycoplasma sp. SG1]URM53166.1 ribose 5-phosphate isomerase B [Mycoplasma sp. SG1]
MKIAIGCDHIAFEMKNQIIDYLLSKKIEVIDCGTYNLTKTHYPMYGREVGLLVSEKKVDLGIVICGTGIGIGIAANKVKGIRAATVRDLYTTIKAKEEYNINVLSFGARIIGQGLAEMIVDAFINTPYLDKNKTFITTTNNLLKANNVSSGNFFKIENNRWVAGYYTDGIEKPEPPAPEHKVQKVRVGTI